MVDDVSVGVDVDVDVGGCVGCIGWSAWLTLKVEMLTRRVEPGLERPPPLPGLPPIQLSHQSIPGQVDWRPRERPDQTVPGLIHSIAHHSLQAQPSLHHKHLHTALQTGIPPTLPKGGFCVEAKHVRQNCTLETVVKMKEIGQEKRDRTARYYVKK